jgi:hypothetical protein
MSAYSGFTPFNSGIPKTQGYAASNFDPQQQSLYNQIYSGIGVNPTQEYSRMASGDESYYAPQEQQALRQFREQVMPTIASRFVGRLGGSAAQGAFAHAGANLSQDLYAERQNIRQNALKNLASIEDNLLNKKTFERHVVDKPDLWDKLQPLLGTLGRSAGAGLGASSGGFTKGVSAAFGAF